MVAIAQATRRWPLTAQNRDQSRVTLSNFRDGRSGTRADSSSSSSAYAANHHSTIALDSSTQVCSSPGQATHYHTIGAKLGSSSLTQYLVALGVNIVLLVRCMIINRTLWTIVSVLTFEETTHRL